MLSSDANMKYTKLLGSFLIGYMNNDKLLNCVEHIQSEGSQLCSW